jgi:hypothetical protein
MTSKGATMAAKIALLLALTATTAGAQSLHIVASGGHAHAKLGAVLTATAHGINQQGDRLALIAADVAARTACGNAGLVYLPAHADADGSGCVDPAIWGGDEAIGGIWRKTGETGAQPVTWTGIAGAHIVQTLTATYGCCVGGGFQWYYAWTSDHVPPANRVNMCVDAYPYTFQWNQISSSFGAWITQGFFEISGQRACALRDNSGSFSIGGINADSIHSDIRPTISFISASCSTTSLIPLMKRMTISCASTCPIVSYLEKNPAFRRKDGSVYGDTSTVLATARVCGVGNLLHGKIEP